jgi:multiple sugar transport system ATP-binding protein
VTHDQVEAMTMADKIVVMNQGEVEQIGAPLELYDHPRNLFVAGFIGSPAMNVFKGRFAFNGTAMFEGAEGLRIPLPKAPAGGDGRSVILGTRPEHLSLSDEGFAAEVVVVEPTGSELQVLARLAGGEEIIAVFHERRAFSPGQTIRLAPEPDFIHLFDGETGERL